MEKRVKNKVIFAVSDVSKHGGIQRFNTILVKSLLELNCHVILICLTSSCTPKNIQDLDDNFSDLEFYGCARNKIKFVKTCLVECITSKPDVAICGHIYQIIPLSIIFYMMRIRSRVLVLHGIEVWDRVSWIKGYLSKLFTRILSVSSYTRDNFISQVKSISVDKNFIFPNTVEPRCSYEADNLKQNNNIKVLLSVTRLDETERDKGIIDVIYALKDLGREDVEYCIVGDGDDKAYLEELVANLNLNSIVKFKGKVTDEQLHQIYSASDIFILPSKKEGFGIVYLEAMLYAKPVIGAAEKGVLDVIKNDHNGYQVQFGNTEDIKKHLELLIDDEKLRKRLGSQGLKDVIGDGRFSYESYVKRVEELILN